MRQRKVVTSGYVLGPEDGRRFFLDVGYWYGENHMTLTKQEMLRCIEECIKTIRKHEELSDPSSTRKSHDEASDSHG